MEQALQAIQYRDIQFSDLTAFTAAFLVFFPTRPRLLIAF